MKLWQKDKASLKEVETFTIGNDREMDMHLAAFDVLGSLAHIEMLESVGLLEKEELIKLQAELKNIYKQIQKREFSLQDDVEDIHSQIELLITNKDKRMSVGNEAMVHIKNNYSPEAMSKKAENIFQSIINT